VIALFGNLARDLVQGNPPRVGGGAFHGARALNRLRVPARIVARCAPADRAELLPSLVALGTPVRYMPSQSTATFAFEYDGEQRRMNIDSLADPWRVDEVPTLPTGVRWIHVAPLARSDFPAATLATLARGRRVSFDGQGLVRASHVGPLELNGDFDPDVLRHLWVLKLADEEAEVLGDPKALPVREVVVTHGSRGSTVYTGGRSDFVPARRIDTEPTGAGDAYCAAYVVARAAGCAPVSAARRATAVVAAVLAAGR
jgi:sugar/nucleoside kinase (ribokinase family)